MWFLFILAKKTNMKAFQQDAYYPFTVTGPPGALLFDVKPEIAQGKSLQLQFQVNCRLGIYCTIFL